MAKDVIFVDLGWVFAKIVKYNEYNDGQAFLYFVSPSGRESETWSPAESITITGLKDILALRDALNSFFPRRP